MKKILWGMLCVLLLIPFKGESQKKKMAEGGKSMMAAEIGDPKYMEMGKKQLMQMASGDMDGWISNFADSAVFMWSAGDSLVGKAAIDKYWRDRRMNTVETVEFLNAIWLPMKVNQPQSIEMPGTWLLSWYQVNVKYKNGKSLVFWVHNDMHYNSADKIDQVFQYIDKAPIIEAMKQ